MPDSPTPSAPSPKKSAASRWIIYSILILIAGVVVWIKFLGGDLVIGNIQEKGFSTNHDPEKEREASQKLEEMGYILAPSAPTIPITTINCCEKPITEEALEQLAYCTNLNALLLNGTKIKDEQLQYLSKMHQLSSLVLNSNPITDAGLKYLEGLDRISDLHLAGTEVGDAGLDSVVKLSKLSILNLSRTKVTDEGLKKLQSLPELANLLLEETAVTDAGLKTIAQFPALKRLSLYKSQVTPAGVRALSNATSGLTIDYQPKSEAADEKAADAKTDDGMAAPPTEEKSGDEKK